jgi:hypothetical protein
MLVLGTSASQNTKNFLGGDFESIATLSGTGSSDSITFSSIPEGYTHLQIRGIAAVNYNSTDFGTIGIRFNGDTGNNYTRHMIRGFRSGGINYFQSGGIANTNFAQAGTAYLRINQGVIGTNIIDILDYNNSNKYKTIRGLSGTNWGTSGAAELNSGVWRSTSSVTSITVFGQNGIFGTETTFALYGIKA